MAEKAAAALLCRERACGIARSVTRVIGAKSTNSQSEVCVDKGCEPKAKTNLAKTRRAKNAAVAGEWWRVLCGSRLRG